MDMAAAACRGGGDGPAKEVVVVTLKAVDRFHDLVLDLFADGGSLEEAERVVRLRLEREARRHGPESAEVAACWRSLGIVFKDGGEYDRALECYRKASPSSSSAVGPEDIRARGHVQQHGDRVQASRATSTRRWSTTARPSPSSSRRSGRSTRMSAARTTTWRSCSRRRATYEQALEHYRKALPIQLKALGPEHPDVGMHVQQHGDRVRAAGRPRPGAGALPQGPRHLAQGARAGAPGGRQDVQQHGERVRGAGRPRAGAGALPQGPRHPAQGARAGAPGGRHETYNNMAVVFQEPGRPRAGDGALPQGPRHPEKALGAHPDVGATYNNMANVFDEQGDLTRRWSTTARRLIQEKAWRPEHPSTLEAKGPAASPATWPVRRRSSSAAPKGSQSRWAPRTRRLAQRAPRRLAASLATPAAARQQLEGKAAVSVRGVRSDFGDFDGVYRLAGEQGLAARSRAPRATTSTASSERRLGIEHRA